MIAKLTDFGLAVNLKVKSTWQFESKEAQSAWQYDALDIRSAFQKGRDFYSGTEPSKNDAWIECETIDGRECLEIGIHFHCNADILD